MSSDTNIRKDGVPQFDSNTLLAPKENFDNGDHSGETTTRPVAEWANLIDCSVKQANQAFNGYPVTALNVKDRIWHSVRSQSLAPFSMVLAKNLAAGSIIHLEAIIYAIEYGSPGQLYMIRRTNGIGAEPIELQASVESNFVVTESYDEFLYEVAGANPASCEFKTVPGANDTWQLIANCVNAPQPMTDVDWVIDYYMRVLPTPQFNEGTDVLPFVTVPQV